MELLIPPRLWCGLQHRQGSPLVNGSTLLGCECPEHAFSLRGDPLGGDLSLQDVHLGGGTDGHGKVGSVAADGAAGPELVPFVPSLASDDLVVGRGTGKQALKPSGAGLHPHDDEVGRHEFYSEPGVLARGDDPPERIVQVQPHDGAPLSGLDGFSRAEGDRVGRHRPEVSVGRPHVYFPFAPDELQAGGLQRGSGDIVQQQFHDLRPHIGRRREGHVAPWGEGNSWRVYPAVEDIFYHAVQVG